MRLKNPRRIHILAGTMTCVLCGSDEEAEFVWSYMFQNYICWLCALELSADYAHPDRWNYFSKAAEKLGKDEMLLRKSYLFEVIDYRNTDSAVSIKGCWQQLRALHRFIWVRKSGTDYEVEEEFQRLLISLKNDSVGLDLE